MTAIAPSRNFRPRRRNARAFLAHRAASGGSRPASVAVSGALVYVLNNGTPSISGFNLTDGKLTALAGSTRPLSGADADPAQISFTPGGGALIATERGTNSISSYVIDERGYAQGTATIKSSGQTLYGFGLTKDGSLIVSEAFGGAVGAAAASSYAVSGAGELTMVSGSVGDTRSEVWWVALTNDDRFAYVTNFGDGTASCYEITADGSLKLHDPVAGSARLGEKGMRDEAVSGDGRYLYAIDADAQKLFGWAVGQGGQLTRRAAPPGTPRPGGAAWPPGTRDGHRPRHFSPSTYFTPTYDAWWLPLIAPPRRWHRRDRHQADPDGAAAGIQGMSAASVSRISCRLRRHGGPAGRPPGRAPARRSGAR